MRNPEDILSNLCKHSSETAYKYERLYRNLFNEQMFYVAYQRIYAKPGNMTPGSDGQSIDQMSTQRIDALISSLKDESYKPKPVRRVYIPKKNGKLRPLGIPSFSDKLVQEVVRMMLEAIYEGHFEDNSHGFRPQRSCHTALRYIRTIFTGTKWFIEGDIKGFFDNIDHGVLIDILRERISDERFLRLIRKFLNVGYLENWQFHNTYSGTPQGGIISPILANIYLDKFDKYMKAYMDGFNKGKKRKATLEYKRANAKVCRYREKIAKEEDTDTKMELMKEYKELFQKNLSMVSGNALDETYRRLWYVRYADDFLIGVIGSKAECVKIKADLTDYMQETLKLELSAEKTLITNARDRAKFLGYEIYVRKTNALTRNCNGVVQRNANAKVVIEAPMEAAKKKLLEYKAMVVKDDGKSPKGYWKPIGRRAHIRLRPEQLVALYNGEIRGFYEYYSLAHNIGKVGNAFGYVMKYSLYKTLAAKYRCRVGRIKSRFRKDKDFVVTYKDAKGKIKHIVLYNGGFTIKNANKFSNVDNLPQAVINVPYPTLAERLMDKCCELCGKEGEELVMHHVRKLTLLKGDKPWEQLMLKRHRKTLAVCNECMQHIAAK